MAVEDAWSSGLRSSIASKMKTFARSSGAVSSLILTSSATLGRARSEANLPHHSIRQNIVRRNKIASLRSV